MNLQKQIAGKISRFPPKTSIHHLFFQEILIRSKFLAVEKKPKVFSNPEIAKKHAEIWIQEVKKMDSGQHKEPLGDPSKNMTLIRKGDDNLKVFLLEKNVEMDSPILANE